MDKMVPWIAAGVLVVFVLILLVVFVILPSPTKPGVTSLPGRLDLVAPPTPLSVVLGSEPSGSGNAGSDYQRAIDAFEADRDTLDGIINDLDGVLEGNSGYSADQVAALEKIAAMVADAAAKAKMSNYTGDEIARPYYAFKAMRYQQLYEVLEALAIHYEISQGKDGYPKAVKCYEDILVMGWHMVNERARFHIVEEGIGFQEGACEMLSALYDKWGKTTKANACREYAGGLLDIRKQYQKVASILETSDGRWGCPHPGDVFNLAANHADRAIRVEAILALGRVKHGQIKKGDAKHTAKLINAALASDDELERGAAKAADEMTEEAIRLMFVEQQARIRELSR